uniref:V-set and transmembrane domain containing 2 like n=1 Tax=Cyprinodon variegatus TaxID=28743 RepID=A0A3Q2GDX9_CYPVA
MGAFRLLLGSLHYLGLYLQLSVSTRQTAHRDMENHISGNAMFTEVPHDMTAQRGKWKITKHLEETDHKPQTNKETHLFLFFETVQVVKVVGSNISHKLRLSRVKTSDEGTYECRVIDFSDEGGARHHRVRAYLQVVPESDVVNSEHNGNFEAMDDTKRGALVVDRELRAAPAASKRCGTFCMHVN